MICPSSVRLQVLAFERADGFPRRESGSVRFRKTYARYDASDPEEAYANVAHASSSLSGIAICGAEPQQRYGFLGFGFVSTLDRKSVV